MKVFNYTATELDYKNSAVYQEKVMYQLYHSFITDKTIWICLGLWHYIAIAQKYWNCRWIKLQCLFEIITMFFERALHDRQKKRSASLRDISMCIHVFVAGVEDQPSRRVPFESYWGRNPAVDEQWEWPTVVLSREGVGTVTSSIHLQQKIHLAAYPIAGFHPPSQLQNEAKTKDEWS